MTEHGQKKHTLYRIYYGDQIVYVGRTNQPLSTRIRGHLFAKPMHRKLDINLVSCVDYHVFESEADMNLYEIYYILKLHPPLNVDDKTKDSPTVHLPELTFHQAIFPLWDKWKKEIEEKDSKQKSIHERMREISEEFRVIRSLWHMGELTEEAYYNKRDLLQDELNELRERIR